jgi:acetoin utilization deacetylase AcuC-like enzyme
MQSRAKNAFCSVRPPGHHAEPDKSMGFCFFNNAAVAARYAIDKYGLSRVAIIDFDVHHGNGTEQIFANDPHVKMFSFFQHPFFPYSGAEDVAPNMHNVPLKAYSGRQEIEEAVKTVWLPIMDAYRPELVIICAGFDAHRDDDMGQMTLVEQDFVWLTKELMAVADRHCQGRVISFLEGGYNINALARSAVEHVRALAGFC